MDEDDLAGFDEAYSFDDFGEGEAFGTGDMAPTTTVSMDSSDEGENIGDFNTLSRSSYDAMRGATPTNPYPESFFSKLLGADKVHYTNILGGGEAGLKRIAEINDLRFRQATGLPSLATGQPYQAGDFYIGQPTAMGEVKPIPTATDTLLNFLPGGGILNAFLSQKGLPEGSKEYQDLMAEEAKSVNDPTIFDNVTSFVRSITGLGPKDSGASLAASPMGDGQMRVPDLRVFDAFGTTEAERADTREEEPIIEIKSIKELADETKRRNAINAVKDMFQRNKPQIRQRVGKTADLSQTFRNMGDEMNQFIGADGKKIGEGNLRVFPDIEKNRLQLQYELPVSNYMDRFFG